LSGATLFETSDGHIVALDLVDGRVSLDWSGLRHAELTPEKARTLGYLLRGYANMAEPSGDPGA
jgi:hypothetical protein